MSLPTCERISATHEILEGAFLLKLGWGRGGGGGGGRGNQHRGRGVRARPPIIHTTTVAPPHPTHQYTRLYACRSCAMTTFSDPLMTK